MRDRSLYLFSFQFGIAFNLLLISIFLQILLICKIHHIKGKVIQEVSVAVRLIYVERIT